MALKKLRCSSAHLNLNTKDCCFICLKCIRRDFGSSLVSDESKSRSFSLSLLFQYLDIIVTEEISEAESESKKSKWDSDISAELCGDCSKISDKVQELVQVIEVARMKIDYQLNVIHEKFRDAARTPSRMSRYHRRMTSDPVSANLLQNIDSLRKRVSTKCWKIGQKSQPKVTIARMDIGRTSFSNSGNSFLSKPFPDDGIFSPSHSDLNSEADVEGSLKSESDNAEESMVIISQAQSLAKKESNFLADNETSEFALLRKRKITIIRTRRNTKPIYSKESCKAATSEKNSLESRDLLKTLTDENDICCRICQKAFSSRQHLKLHLECIHLGIRRFKCEHCDKRFGLQKDLIRHRDAVHYHRRLKCTVSGCNKDYARMNALRAHQKSAHPETISVRKKRTLKISGRQCKICQKTYSSTQSLQEHHDRVHMGIRKFECDICGKKFANAKDGKRHRDSVHLRIRRLCVFPGCKKKYSDVTHLRYHQKIAHPGWHPNKVTKSSENARDNCEVTTLIPRHIKQELD